MLLHSEQSNLRSVLANLSAVGLRVKLLVQDNHAEIHNVMFLSRNIDTGIGITYVVLSICRAISQIFAYKTLLDPSIYQKNIFCHLVLNYTYCLAYY